MIRVLQCVNDMHRAGLETMLMNYYRRMDRSEIQFDFLTHRPWRSEYDEEIEALGGKVYYAPRLMPQNYPAYFRYMDAFFREHPEYRIVHSHIDSMSYLPLLCAKKAGVPVRIAHSHNTAQNLDYKILMKEIFRRKIPSVATDFLACGTRAGEFLFGDREFLVIPNAIDPAAFRFNSRKRAETRAALGIGNEYVIGSVGRLTRQKNLPFLLRIFKEIHEKDRNTILLLIGGGEEEVMLRKLAESLCITDRVRFLGVRKDVAALYMAMDVLVMPSRYEGLPVVGVEAQFSDLDCVFSSEITEEIRLSPKARFLSISRPAEDWAEYILRLKNRKTIRKNDFQCERFDITYAKTILEQYYKIVALRMDTI